MVSMYSINPMMYSAMYSPMMYGSMYSQNVPSYYHQRYGCGNEDFGTRPYTRQYTMGISQQSQTVNTQPTGNWFTSYIRDLFR